MMTDFKAKVLYDFLGESENEISIKEGDTVTVLNTDVGDGWWFGRTSDGKEGMFPLAYVEQIDDSSSMPPPPAPIMQSSTDSSWQKGDTWQTTGSQSTAANYTNPDPGWASFGNNDTSSQDRSHKNSISSFNDDWNSEEDDSLSSNAPTTVQQPYSVQQVEGQPQGIQRPKPPLQATDSNRSSAGEKKFKLPFGKSSSFDNFLMGSIESSATTAAEAIDIINVTGFLYWKPSTSQYTCTIGVPQKGAKYGGLKGFMTYPVTPSFNNIQVSRRYKHFDWLHERLTSKYGATIAIPPLPDKQLTGRYEEELIEKRRIELQSFTDRICRHPVLSQSAVWLHFITETNDKQWTAGKRKAESDSLVGASFLCTLQAPEEVHEDEIISQFKTTLGRVDNSVKALFSVTQEQANRYRSTHKKDMQSLGQALSSLGSSLNSRVPSLERIGESFSGLADCLENQAVKSWDPIIHLLHDYKGLVSAWQEILNAYFSCKDRQKEIETTSGDKEAIISRSRINLYRIGVMCEINHFYQEIEADLNHAAQVLVYEQITHYKDMAQRMETLYSSCFAPKQIVNSTAEIPAASTGQSIPQLPTSSAVNLDPWAHSEGIYEEMP